MVPPLRWLSLLLLPCGFGVALLIPAEATADKVSNAMAECQGKTPGEACALAGRKGACEARAFERPNGMSRRWVECSPGKKPDRKAKDQKIDAAGPVGVLPSVGSVEGDAPVEPPANNTVRAETPDPSRAKVEAPEAGAEPANPSALDKVEPEPEGSPSPTLDAEADRSAAPESPAPETRGGCRLEVSELPLGLTLGLAGLLLMAGRRRGPSTKQRYK